MNLKRTYLNLETIPVLDRTFDKKQVSNHAYDLLDRLENISRDKINGKNYRIAIEQKHFYDKSFTEIGKILGITRQAAWQLYVRAIGELKNIAGGLK